MIILIHLVCIERVIKVTNRRVNALEFVIIPQIEHTIKWIEGELDELDREDFYRLKCVQDKKKEAKELELKELKAKMAAARGDADAVDDGEEDNNLFKDEQGEWEEEDENDIIF